MRDWGAFVRATFAASRDGAVVDDLVCEELAGHLAEVHAEALRDGATDTEATARALACVPDWLDLAEAVSRHRRGGPPMSETTRTVWIPGLAMTVCAAAAIAAVTTLESPARWADPRPWTQWLAAGIALTFYAGLGAAGAAWSRRAGGTVWARLGAGLFPVALHVALLLPPLAGDVAFAVRHPPVRLALDLGPVLALIVAPALALTLGAWPYLGQGRAR